MLVKLSSLGDILHAYAIPTYLKQLFPKCTITWACDTRFAGALKAHPHIDKVVGLSVAKLKSRKGRGKTFLGVIKSLLQVRKEKFDHIFDLQSNLKSGLLLSLMRGENKVGFTFKSSREWPASLFVNRRLTRKEGLHKSEELLDVVGRYFSSVETKTLPSPCFELTPDEQKVLDIFKKNKLISGRYSVMIAMGASRVNKQLSRDLWVQILNCLSNQYSIDFFCVWGSSSEEREVEKVQELTRGRVYKLSKMSIALWQGHMRLMHALIGLDSSALHLAATIDLPTFAFFGPTLPAPFNPKGSSHQFYQGSCPYSAVFEDSERCVHQKDCLTGACLKSAQLSHFEAKIQSWFKNEVLFPN